MNVFSNIAIDTHNLDMVRIASNERQNKVLFGDALFTASSETPEECGMSSIMTEKPKEDIYLNSFCFGFRFNEEGLFYPDFLKHLLRSKDIRKQIIKTASGVTRFNVSKKRMEKIKIPLPPLSEQRRIAGILDKFEALTTSLQDGLPAEIAARRKQYEHYREQLLSFKRKEK